MPQTFCYHRWSIVKRWTVKDEFHAIQKCRRCQRWKRTDLGLDADKGKLEISHAFERPALENQPSSDGNPIRDSNSEDGNVI